MLLVPREIEHVLTADTNPATPELNASAACVLVTAMIKWLQVTTCTDLTDLRVATSTA